MSSNTKVITGLTLQHFRSVKGKWCFNGHCIIDADASKHLKKDDTPPSS